jgi:hypothetical protein
MLGVIDPVIALGPRFKFESWARLEVPKPYADVDLGEAWEACREDAHTCQRILETDGSLEAVLIAYRNSVQWSRFWAERFPSSEWRMRFWEGSVRLEEGLERLREKANWKFEIGMVKELSNI